MTCASVCTPPHLSVGTHPTNPTPTTPRPPCEATYLTDPQWLVLLPRNTHPVAKPPNATKSHTLTNSTPSKTSKIHLHSHTDAKRTKAPTPNERKHQPHNTPYVTLTKTPIFHPSQSPSPWTLQTPQPMPTRPALRQRSMIARLKLNLF